ncbi:MAG TPA: hypothetical protein PK323_10815 [Bacteroidia bacterium]|nr:hypothetical protein [Bacteroidia bacterium]
MRKLIFAINLLLIIGCSTEKLDMNAATKTAEIAIKHIGNKEFNSLFELYAKDFAASESQEIREKKLGKIIEAVGKVEEMSLLDSIRIDNSGEESSIVVRYKVKHANTTTTESFTIIKEDGKYVLSDINITNQ